jgi:hypothetical protein
VSPLLTSLSLPPPLLGYLSGLLWSDLLCSMRVANLLMFVSLLIECSSSDGHSVWLEVRAVSKRVILGFCAVTACLSGLLRMELVNCGVPISILFFPWWRGDLVNITFDESLIGRSACGWPNYFLKKKLFGQLAYIHLVARPCFNPVWSEGNMQCKFMVMFGGFRQVGSVMAECISIFVIWISLSVP